MRCATEMAADLAATRNKNESHTLTVEDVCNLERLTVCHIDVQKSKVESCIQNLLGDFNGP